MARKFTVLGAMHDDRSVADVIAYTYTYEEAELEIELYVASDPMVEYDFYFIEEV